MTTVTNLSTGHKIEYSCEPRAAVMAAYAQALRDFNTWDYARRYSHLIEETPIHVCCGDFCAPLENVTPQARAARIAELKATAPQVEETATDDNRAPLPTAETIAARAVVEGWRVVSVNQTYAGDPLKTYTVEAPADVFAVLGVKTITIDARAYQRYQPKTARMF